MKKTNLIILLIASLFIAACGTSNSDDHKSDSKNNKSSSGTIYEDENIVVNSRKGWEGKKGPNGLKFYTWAIESSGDIYKDIDDQYSENLSDIEEINIDGLPALTKLKKYQQNETIKERVWLIYNGKNVIQFSVMAPLDKYDDVEANEVIKMVKIKEREANVVLPEATNSAILKPDHFPQQIAAMFTDYMGEQIVLSIEAINNAKAFNNQLKQIQEGTSEIKITIDKDNMIVLDSIASTHNLNNWGHFELIVNSCGAAIDPLIKLMADIETIEKGSENYKLTADAIQQILNQSKVSLADLNFAYENWDFVSEFIDGLK